MLSELFIAALDNNLKLAICSPVLEEFLKASSSEADQAEGKMLSDVVHK